MRPVLEDRIAQLAKAPTTSPRRADQDAAVRAKLDKKLPELTFNAAPLDEMILYLEQFSGVAIHVNWPEIDAAGVGRKTPITARLRDVKLSKALDVLLRDAGGERVRLGHAIVDGTLTISTADDLARNVVTSVYDIRDLTAAAVPGSATQQQLINEVIRLIQDTVASTSWKANGGSSGVIRELQGQLIITQTRENQNDIANLFSQLRETRAIQINVEASIIELDDAIPASAGYAIDDGKLGAFGPTPGWMSAPTTQPGNIATDLIGGGTQKTERRFLDDAQVRQITAAARSRITLPTLTLFNGGDASTKTQTTSGTTELYVQATVSSDRRFVTVTTKLSSDTPATTISIPDGATAIVQSYDKPVSAEHHKWLLIKPSIIVQRRKE